MAFKMRKVTRHGMDLPEAYIQIQDAQFDSEVMSVTLSVHINKDSQDKEPIEYMSFDISFEDEPGLRNSLFNQLYAILKKMPEFSEAVDVQEVEI